MVIFQMKRIHIYPSLVIPPQKDTRKIKKTQKIEPDLNSRPTKSHRDFTVAFDFIYMLTE